SERLAVQKLHREKFNLSVRSRSRVDFENPAHVRMADFAGVAHFGGKPFMEAGLGALECDALPESFIHRFINDTHSALRQFANNAEAAVEYVSRFQAVLFRERPAERVEQKALHTVLPTHVVPHLVE